MSAKLEAIRVDIETHLSAIETLTSTPRTVDEALATVLAQYDKNAAESSGLGMLRGTLFENEGVHPFTIGGIYNQTLIGVDSQTLFALMGRDAVERQSRTLLEQHAANFPAGVTKEQRTSRMAELKSKLHKLEIDEEKTILSLESGDTFIPRRREADPKVILEAWNAYL